MNWLLIIAGVVVLAAVNIAGFFDNQARSALQDTLFDTGYEAIMKADPMVQVSTWIMWKKQLSKPENNACRFFS